MKRGLNIKSYIGIGVALCISLLCLFDMLDYNANSLDYERVYHIGSEGVKWKYQSGQNFIFWNIGLIVLAITYIATNLFYLIKFQESRILKTVLLCIEIGWFIWAVWFIYSWYLIDFDHW